MRWLFIFTLVGLALAGCVTEHGKLHDLGQRAKYCGSVGYNCSGTADVSGIVACMNDALGTGTLAEVIWSDEATGLDYYIFTEADHFRVFTEDYDSSGDSEVHDDYSCTGPLKTTTIPACGEYFQPELDGC